MSFLHPLTFLIRSVVLPIGAIENVRENAPIVGKPLSLGCLSPKATKLKINKGVSKTDTNPPFAFQIAFPRSTDFAGFLQGGSKSRDLQSEISVRIESRIESADSRLQRQC